MPAAGELAAIRTLSAVERVKLRTADRAGKGDDAEGALSHINWCDEQSRRGFTLTRQNFKADRT